MTLDDEEIEPEVFLVYKISHNIVRFQKICITPPRRVIRNSKGEGGSQKPTFLKESMSLNWNFQKGGGLNQKSPPWGEYGYFLEQHINVFK